MTRTSRLTLSLAGTIALAGAIAGPAPAPAAKSRAKIYRATLAPAAAVPYASVKGTSKVVDNKKRDTATISIKGLLKPGAIYSWSIYRTVGTGPACDVASAGATIAAFRYKDLKVTPAGTASATAKSKTFVAFTNKRYVVAVRDEEGEVVACGQLKRTKK